MTQIIYYGGIFAASALLTLWYILLWREQFDEHLTLLFAIMPILTLAYLLMYTCHDVEASMALSKIVYVGCYLPWLTTMCVMSLCHIPVSRPIRLTTFLISSCVFLAVLTIGYTPLYYKSLTVERIGNAWVQRKEYGPMHQMHQVCILLYLIADVIAIYYAYRKKHQVSRHVLIPLFLPIPISIASYFAGSRVLPAGYELTPLSYMLAQILYLLIARRMVLYNVSEVVIESMVQTGDIGFITVDLKGRYLGCNETAERILPPLRELPVDRAIREAEGLRDTVSAWLDASQSEAEAAFTYTLPGEEETIYLVRVYDLFDGGKKRGRQITMQDDTKNQQYIRLLDRYNADLQKDVAEKTETIVAMHDRLILSMAAMVESRDNSTGGHIRRTSEGVRLLLEAIRRDSGMELSKDFCKKLAKAAPMHDLGKIAVDDAVLRKAGRYTPEEYDKMKIHAAEGARIVHEILQDTDDEDFRRIAENVAHYHHERYDGSGYPDGLKGEEIPLEARIMAIADVYDALVSKRVYKDAFSFEKADRIIREGMGTQFDPKLEPCYLAARPELEAFYEARREERT